MEGTSGSPVTFAKKSSSDERQLHRRSYPAIVHAAFISTFILPIAFIPYFLARRQLVFIRHRADVLEKDMQRLKNDLRATISNQRLSNSDLRHLKTTLHENLKGSAVLRHQINRQEADRISSSHEIQKELRKLVNDARHSRSQLDMLYPLGKSLADIAAFMQELEMRIGLQPSDSSKDQRGIERLRLLALRLHSPNLSQQPKKHKLNAEEDN
ncbi:hypothetical protein BDN70DRAFT_871487 [Pholiota conissans]|uniref:Uncharacterized protein n=1 Tax=Pholiota conissans TaxID=109636 RepID=A0A9P5ZGF3_9AGAR|nr:hypothetical protein BDN70DRAFT_871487 [Pholiota conissans]